MNPHKITALFFNLVLAFGIATAALPAQAAVPATLNYQGQLANAAGAAVNGTVSMVFSLYDVESGGAALWSETQQSVAVSNGQYNITLGSTTPLTSGIFGVPMYLGIKVAADAEMTPRIALSSSATALRADSFDGSNVQTTASPTNTFLGVGAGNATMMGLFNTASGEGALYRNTTGSANTASGVDALKNNSTGS